jgi:hypothetical protein
MTIKYIVGGTIVALSLAACGSQASGTSIVPAAPPAATPTPTPDLYPSAKAAYLAAASTGNVAVGKANTALNNATTIAQATAAYKLMVVVHTNVRAALFAITFPTNMKADVNALIGATSDAILAFNDAADDPTASGPQAAISAAYAAVVAASNSIRHDLGLPPTG